MFEQRGSLKCVRVLRPSRGGLCREGTSILISLTLNMLHPFLFYRVFAVALDIGTHGSQGLLLVSQFGTRFQTLRSNRANLRRCLTISLVCKHRLACTAISRSNWRRRKSLMLSVLVHVFPFMLSLQFTLPSTLTIWINVCSWGWRLATSSITSSTRCHASTSSSRSLVIMICTG